MARFLFTSLPAWFLPNALPPAPGMVHWQESSILHDADATLDTLLGPEQAVIAVTSPFEIPSNCVF